MTDREPDEVESNDNNERRDIDMTEKRSTTTGRRPAGRGSATTPAERATVSSLALAGMSGAEIAKRTGRHRLTVRRILSSAEHQEARELARTALAQNAVQFAVDWARASVEAASKGRHEPARDALLSIKAIEPPTAAPVKAGWSVRVGVMLPGLGEAARVAFEAQQQSDGEVVEATRTDDQESA